MAGETERKVKMLVYATEDERARIKMTAAKLHMSMSQLMLDSVLEQVGSIESLGQDSREFFTDLGGKDGAAK